MTLTIRVDPCVEVRALSRGGGLCDENERLQTWKTWKTDRVFIKNKLLIVRNN